MGSGCLSFLGFSLGFRGLRVWGVIRRAFRMFPGGGALALKVLKRKRTRARARNALYYGGLNN